MIDPGAVSADGVQVVKIDGASWPGLKEALASAREWRPRSLYVTVDTVNRLPHCQVGAYLCQADWKPADIPSLVNNGGRVRPATAQAWSSNIMPAVDDWTNVANGKGNLYIVVVGLLPNEKLTNFVTLRGTIQVRGHK